MIDVRIYHGSTMRLRVAIDEISKGSIIHLRYVVRWVQIAAYLQNGVVWDRNSSYFCCAGALCRSLYPFLRKIRGIAVVTNAEPNSGVA